VSRSSSGTALVHWSIARSFGPGPSGGRFLFRRINCAIRSRDSRRPKKSESGRSSLCSLMPGGLTPAMVAYHDAPGDLPAFHPFRRPLPDRHARAVASLIVDRPGPPGMRHVVSVAPTGHRSSENRKHGRAAVRRAGFPFVGNGRYHPGGLVPEGDPAETLLACKVIDVLHARPCPRTGRRAPLVACCAPAYTSAQPTPTSAALNHRRLPAGIVAVETVFLRDALADVAGPAWAFRSMNVARRVASPAPGRCHDVGLRFPSDLPPPA